MEIDEVGAHLIQKYVTEVQSPKQQEKVTDQRAQRIQKRDEATLSSEGQLFQKAFQAALEAPDVRAQLVTQLRQRIEGGAYQVDAAKIAEKLLGSEEASEPA